MTPAELRLLDAWIAFNVTKVNNSLVQIQEPDIAWMVPHYTTDPAASFAVLEKCLQRDAYTTSNFFERFSTPSDLKIELAKFARVLFQGKEKV